MISELATPRHDLGSIIRSALETLAFITIGAWSIWDGFRLTAAARREGLFDPLGPDRYLMVVGVVMVALGIANLLTSQSEWQIVQGPGESKASRQGAFRFALLTLAFAAYAIIAPLTGYVLATIMFFAAAYSIMGLHGWIALPLAIALSTATFAVIFLVLTAVPLPRGILGFPF